MARSMIATKPDTMLLETTHALQWAWDNGHSQVQYAKAWCYDTPQVSSDGTTVYWPSWITADGGTRYYATWDREYKTVDIKIYHPVDRR